MQGPPSNRPEIGSVTLIVCYFGLLPSYSQLVFHSIAANSSITWIVFGDHKPEFDLPQNVIWQQITIRDLEVRFSEILGFHISIRAPYELCNLRPAYGKLFGNELANCQFWGHTDLDMIYGDLRQFLPDSVMSSHDRIYARGHLSLYRNSEEVNNAFKLPTSGIPPYQEIFQNPGLRPQFDEWPGIWKIFRQHGLRQYHKEVIADIKPPTPFKNLRFEMTELENYPIQFFYWHQGKTFQSFYHREGGLMDREVAYIHFQKRPMPAPRFTPEKIRGFTVGPQGFTPYDRENFGAEEILAQNHSVDRSLNDVVKHLANRVKLRFSKAARRTPGAVARAIDNHRS